jgi:hypothetical protein
VFRTKFWLGAAVITGAQVIGYGLAKMTAGAQFKFSIPLSKEFT